MSARLPSLWPLVVVGVLAAGPALAAPPLALLPASGSADPESKKALDGALRTAAMAESDFELQSARETAEHIATMADFGAVCVATDLVCLQKLGILASVDFLIVPEARGKRTLDVTLVLLDVAKGDIVRTVDATVRPSDADDIETLVRRALHGDDPAPRPDAAATPRPPTDAAATTPLVIPEGPLDETALTDLQFAGAAVAGVGGGLGAISLLGALACEAIFWTGTGPADTRKNVVAPTGAALWIGAIVGTAAAGVGGALYLAGAPPDDGGID